MTFDLRGATPLDAGGAGRILAEFVAHTPWMPQLYSEAETISLCGQMIDKGWVTVATLAGRCIGFLACRGSEVLSLFVDQHHRGQGIGKALLDYTKQQTDNLHLRTFQANMHARRFYLREGFAEIGSSDGSVNDENLPDILFQWQRNIA